MLGPGRNLNTDSMSDAVFEGPGEGLARVVQDTESGNLFIADVDFNDADHGNMWRTALGGDLDKHPDLYTNRGVLDLNKAEIMWYDLYEEAETIGAGLAVPKSQKIIEKFLKNNLDKAFSSTFYINGKKVTHDSENINTVLGFSNKEHTHNPKSPWVKRVDYAAIKEGLDNGDKEFAQTFADIMARGKKHIYDQVAVLAGDKSFGSIDPASITEVGRMPRQLVTELRTEIRKALQKTLDLNYELAKKELPDRARKMKEIRPGMDKLQAERFLSSRAMKIAGVIEQDVLDDVQHELENAIKYDKSLRDTMASIESNTDLTAVLPRVDSGGRAINVPARIENIVRTNDAEAMNSARMALFGEPEFKDFIQAYEYSAILDDRTTEECAALNGEVRKDWGSLTPPNHYQCRSILVPVTEVDDWDGKQSKLPDWVKPQKGFS
jgi:SPP1 gp7 family putative phage head morphogenesis protein